MLSEPILNLLVQIPLVGAFMWLMLKIMERQDAREEKREALDRDERRDRDAAWQKFLTEQRTASNDAIGRIAEEVKSLATEQSAMLALLSAHDASSREARMRKADA